MPGLSGTVGTAVDRAVHFHAVAYDLAAAVRAARRERVRRALEAVEGVRIAPGHGHLERLVVLVAADLASRHFHHSLPRCRLHYMFVSLLTPARNETIIAKFRRAGNLTKKPASLKLLLP